MSRIAFFTGVLAITKYRLRGLHEFLGTTDREHGRDKPG